MMLYRKNHSCQAVWKTAFWNTAFWKTGLWNTAYWNTALLKTLLILLCLLNAALLTSCSSSSLTTANEPKEIPLTDEPRMEGSQSELFQTAKKLYASGYQIVARDAFQSIIDTDPTTAYAEFSALKLADTTFISRKYPEAAAEYENFIKSYPTSANRPYALMRAGLSHRLTNTALGRDQEPLHKSVKHFTAFLDEYPDSYYREGVTKHLEEVKNQLIDHEKLIADFYQSQGKHAAAKRRLRASEKIARESSTQPSQ